jgi:hypothetical protein
MLYNRKLLITMALVIFFGWLAFLLYGCGVSDYTIHRDLKVSQHAIDQMNELYNPLIEKGFCVSRDEVYNVLVGGLMFSEVPLCRRTDIVMHTHPFWGEKWANWLDTAAWDEYYEKYQGWRFGIMMGPGDFLLYDHK